MINWNENLKMKIKLAAILGWLIFYNILILFIVYHPSALEFIKNEIKNNDFF